MSDITMCTSENCKYINKCYRARAKPEKHQSWSNFEYTCNENSGFEDFIPLEHEHEYFALNPPPTRFYFD